MANRATNQPRRFLFLRSLENHQEIMVRETLTKVMLQVCRVLEIQEYIIHLLKIHWQRVKSQQCRKLCWPNLQDVPILIYQNHRNRWWIAWVEPCTRTSLAAIMKVVPMKWTIVLDLLRVEEHNKLRYKTSPDMVIDVQRHRQSPFASSKLSSTNNMLKKYAFTKETIPTW